VYRRAAVATTFSPRFRAVLAEANRLAKLFDVPLDLIHADESNPEKEERFATAMGELGLPAESTVHFEPGEPVKSILSVQDRIGIDLLIAGALERESVHRNFTGNVARELLRQAACDLFLFVKPEETPAELTHVFVAIPNFSQHSRSAYKEGVSFAEKIGVPELTLLHVQTTFAEAKEKGKTTEPPVEESLAEFVADCGSDTVHIDTHQVRGNTGFTACEYIQSAGADLLILPSHSVDGNRPPFEPVLDWIIQVIPSNVWVIRER